MEIYAIVGTDYFRLDSSSVAATYPLATEVGTNYEAAYGLGAAPVHRLTSHGPGQHGATDRGFILEPRTLRLVLGIHGDTYPDMETQRTALYDIFTPTTDPVQLRWVSAGGVVRQLDVFATRIEIPIERRGFTAQAVLILTTSNPLFYQPVGRSVTFALNPVGAGFQIPWEIPWRIGASALNQTLNVTVDGNFRAYPYRIRFVGPLTNPIFTNLTTAEKLDFTGTVIADGDYYDLDLRYALKIVEDSAGNNQTAALTSDSDLATWHLAAHPEAAGGVNALNIQAAGANSNTEIYVQWYDNFTGL